MSLYSASVKKPITTMMIFIGVLIFGIYSYLKLPVDFYPKIEPPMITLFTFYSGAGAADVEQNVTRKLEDVLGSITNLKKIYSTSKDNISVIFLEFTWGTNLDEATNEIRNAVGMVRNLPEGVETPTILKMSSNMIPVMAFSVTSDESYEGIRDILDQKVIQPLNRIDGVGNVFQIGAPVRAVMVDVDPRKLDAYNLSVEQIGGILAANNLNLPSGRVELGKTDLPLRLQGEFKSSEAIKNIIISNINGKPVYLKDVAIVKDSLKYIKSYEKANGRNTVRIMVQKQSDANTVTVASKVKKKLTEIQKTLPADVKINIIIDTSEFTTAAINNLSETLLYALLFVVIVVFAFLGRWRTTIIISLSIPISLIAGFIYMYVSGQTINIITLSSMAIAIGMVVDDSIVVLENISKKVERGGFLRESAIYGTNEVSLAVIATTLTVLAVFLPLTMVGGMTGILFKSLGWVVSITITSSTIVALTLVPMLSSKILTTEVPKRKGLKGSFYHFSRNMLNKMDAVYGKILDWSICHKPIVISTAVLIFIFSLFLLKVVGTEFMPPSDNDRITAQIKLEKSIRLSETIKTANRLDSVFMKYPEIEIVSTSAGIGDESENNLMSIFSENGNYIINYIFKMKPVKERKRSIFEIASEMREDIEKITEIESFNVDAGGSRSARMMGGGGGNYLEVKVFGNNLDATNSVAEEISKRLKNIKGAKDILVSRDKEKPELQLEIDNEKMTSFGLTTAAVATAIRNRINGMTATKYREEGNEYNVIVRYHEEFRNSTEDLLNISIFTPQGKIIKLGEIARLKRSYSPPSIERENKVRVVTVSAAISGAALGTVKSSLEKEIRKMNIPSDVTVEFSGSVEDMQESFRSIIMLMILVILLVYIVMAAQFESLLEPFIIMFSVPFSFTGVFLSLYIFGITLNIISFIGAVMLIGIVVKNGIVLVDYTNLLLERGYSLKDGVVAGGKSRLRPVLMTSLTTILAMVPLISSTGSSSEMWRPMGVAVAGGLTFSTLITLILIPTLYSTICKGKEKKCVKTA